MLGEGPIPARIMLVGECYGYEDARACAPFQGPSGQELNRMLHKAGIMRSECYCTNLLNERPQGGTLDSQVAWQKKQQTVDHVRLHDLLVTPKLKAGYESLLREIELVQPNIIVAMGNLPMYALTKALGITKWRGSALRQLLSKPGEAEELRPKVIPTFTPGMVLAQWATRAMVITDLKRVAKERASRVYESVPDWKFIVRPGYKQTIDTLQHLIQQVDLTPDYWIDFDLETRAGHIACAGLSWSREEAICIPFMSTESRGGYWCVEWEAQIVFLLYKLLTHPNVRVRWQNGLYDAQYTYRHWHFIPRGVQDTLISQHTAFVALPKSLAFQSSLYSPHYVYWKDDGKTWDANQSEDQLWRYNCIDCVRTREVGEEELKVIDQLGMQEVEAFQQKLFWPVLRAMNRGILVDQQKRKELAVEIEGAIADREQFLRTVLGRDVNINSSPQMQDLFYNVLGQQPVLSKAKKGAPSHVTCDDEALQVIARRQPMLKPVVDAIADIRTLRVFLSTFILATLDRDGRMRCSYNIGGSVSGKSAPYTYRLSSSQNAFGGGANLQNIPSEKSKSIGKAKARGMTFTLPNMRSMYVPDPGMTFFDMDLDRADLQVVVWEAEDEELMQALRMGADIHLLNVYLLDGKEPPPLEELVESHPRYEEHKGPRKLKREFAKVFCHASNYGGGARTVAAHTGRSVHEIDQAQKRWFAARPGIKRWHDRTLHQIQTHRFVENRFGYRWHIFDRLEQALPAALAWVPQSTVGCYINRIWMAIYEQIPEVEVLIQVHDSLAGQFPSHLRDHCVQRIQEVSRIEIPYERPLVIPTGMKLSTVSWGDCR